MQATRFVNYVCGLALDLVQGNPGGQKPNKRCITCCFPCYAFMSCENRQRIHKTSMGENVTVNGP